MASAAVHCGSYRRSYHVALLSWGATGQSRRPVVTAHTTTYASAMTSDYDPWECPDAVHVAVSTPRKDGTGTTVVNLTFSSVDVEPPWSPKSPPKEPLPSPTPTSAPFTAPDDDPEHWAEWVEAKLRRHWVAVPAGAQAKPGEIGRWRLAPRNAAHAELHTTVDNYGVRRWWLYYTVGTATGVLQLLDRLAGEQDRENARVEVERRWLGSYKSLRTEGPAPAVQHWQLEPAAE